MQTLAQQFSELSLWLAAHRELWEPRPFEWLTLPWEEQYPQISNYLQAAHFEAATGLDAELIEATNAPPLLRRWRDEAEDLSYCSALVPHTDANFLAHDHANWKIPLRKRRQIESFAEIIDDGDSKAGQVVDWCAGKGHLGRHLATKHQRNVVCLEQSLALCDKGAALAKRAGVNCAMKQLDVMTEAVESFIQPTSRLVALHACGFLNQRLLQLAVRVESTSIALAPCCYHKLPTTAEFFTPLSELGSQHDLNLDQHALRLPTTEQVVAGRGKKTIRGKQALYRMALDLLLREASGLDRYRTLPPAPNDWVRLSCSDFCLTMADRFFLTLPEEWDEATLLKEAKARLNRSQKFGVVRRLFRRPLELWLILDRALYLEEHGYETKIGRFCHHKFTPRNIAIVAERL